MHRSGGGTRHGHLRLAPTAPTSGMNMTCQTVGVFRLGANSVLFTVISDPDERLTVWAYTCLDVKDAERWLEPSSARLMSWPPP